MGAGRAALIVAGLLAVSGDAQAPPAGKGDRSVVLAAQGGRLTTVVVHQGAGHPPVSLPVLSGAGGFDSSRRCVEVVNLPPAWGRIEALASARPTSVVSRGQPPERPSWRVRPGHWYLRHWGLSLVFLLLAVYASAMVGESGGPNNGEHPFICNLCHLVAFFVLAKAWDPVAHDVYRNLLLALLGLSLLVIPVRSFRSPVLAWFLKLVMLAGHGALFFILCTKTYPPEGRWPSPESLQVYVPPRDRGELEFLAADGEVLARFDLATGIDCPTLVPWRGEKRPAQVWIVAPDGRRIPVPVAG